MNSELKEYALSLLSQSRRETIEQVLDLRSKHVTVVLEDFYQPHNFSAVLRSCDIFGVQDVHIIENKNEYQTNPKVNMGSDKWINIHRHNKQDNNSLACISHLKKNGYQVLAAHPHETGQTLFDLDLSQKTAFIFGTELEGISDLVKKEADGFFAIPMYGFTESFNVSVAAALTLSHVRKEFSQNPEINWRLNSTEKELILKDWLSKCISHFDKLEQEFKNRQL